jgi:hypothetical protein
MPDTLAETGIRGGENGNGDMKGGPHLAKPDKGEKPVLRNRNAPEVSPIEASTGRRSPARMGVYRQGIVFPGWFSRKGAKPQRRKEEEKEGSRKKGEFGKSPVGQTHSSPKNSAKGVRILSAS